MSGDGAFPAVAEPWSVVEVYSTGRIVGWGAMMRAKNASRGIRLERDPSLLAGQHFGRQKCHPGYRQVGSTDAGLEVERYERKAVI